MQDREFPVFPSPLSHRMSGGATPSLFNPIRIHYGVFSLHARHRTFWYSPSLQFQGAYSLHTAGRTSWILHNDLPSPVLARKGQYRSLLPEGSCQNRTLMTCGRSPAAISVPLTFRLSSRYTVTCCRISRVSCRIQGMRSSTVPF